MKFKLLGLTMLLISSHQYIKRRNHSMDLQASKRHATTKINDLDKNISGMERIRYCPNINTDAVCLGIEAERRIFNFIYTSHL